MFRCQIEIKFKSRFHWDYKSNIHIIYIVCSSRRSMKNGSRKKCATSDQNFYIFDFIGIGRQVEKRKKKHWNLNGTKNDMRFDGVLWIYISCEIMFKLEFETSSAVSTYTQIQITTSESKIPVRQTILLASVFPDSHNIHTQIAGWELQIKSI